ncbi:RNA polymerase sigma factor [Planctomycetota bacterium]
MRTTTGLAGEVVRRGTPEARQEHAALFGRIVARIHGFFRKSVWDPDEVEDCVQRTLLLIEESLVARTYDPALSFNTWMWLKAHTVFAQWCRERKRRPVRLPHGQSEPSVADPATRTDERLDAETVLRTIQERLGDESYEVFCLYYEAGLSQEEIACAVSRDRKTVRKRLRAAHALIDRLL